MIDKEETLTQPNGVLVQHMIKRVAITQLDGGSMQEMIGAILTHLHGVSMQEMIEATLTQFEKVSMREVIDKGATLT